AREPLGCEQHGGRAHLGRAGHAPAHGLSARTGCGAGHGLPRIPVVSPSSSAPARRASMFPMALDRISLVVPPVGPWRTQERWYRWAEDVGYDAVYTYDHLTHATSPGLWLGEAFTTLTAAAAVTDRVLLGTLVASAVLRTPVALARVAMTVQDITA